ncbi:uncharacterized protein LOC119719117 [Patiria miniata]|uniref:Uncharacterized protein n=1 Tax=Patiria miniata TaxID=46514 RepID=A0A913Z121_PATMI|nr:uncharacterized protein LOC119719117 [Patiria miniata]
MKVASVFGHLLVLFTLTGGVLSVCCPSCGTRSITRLNVTQLQQVEDNRAFIEELDANPDLLYSSEYQREVVTLTRKQEYEILRNFPEVFLTEQAYMESKQGLGTITTPNTTVTRRRRAASEPERVCPPYSDTEPVILVRKAGGQVVQLSNTGSKNQWIFAETCDQSTPPPSGQKCGLIERHVPALFINLSGILDTGGSSDDFDFAQVIIQCCVTIRS